jgi:hypothetical protein
MRALSTISAAQPHHLTIGDTTGAMYLRGEIATWLTAMISIEASPILVHPKLFFAIKERSQCFYVPQFVEVDQLFRAKLRCGTTLLFQFITERLVLSIHIVGLFRF